MTEGVICRMFANCPYDIIRGLGDWRQVCGMNTDMEGMFTAHYRPLPDIRGSFRGRIRWTEGWPYNRGPFDLLSQAKVSWWMQAQQREQSARIEAHDEAEEDEAVKLQAAAECFLAGYDARVQTEPESGAITAIASQLTLLEQHELVSDRARDVYIEQRDQYVDESIIELAERAEAKGAPVWDGGSAILE